MWQELSIWIAISVIAVAIDLFTSSFLFVWFALGGVVAILLSVFNYTFTIQLIAFIIVSIVLMVLGYPIVKKSIKDTVPITPRMEEEYIGEEFISDKDIKDKATIKIKGIYWTVKNTGNLLKKGDKFKVIGIEGNRLIIVKI